MDVVTKNLYPTKYPIIVMVMLNLFCDEVKGFFLLDIIENYKP